MKLARVLTFIIMIFFGISSLQTKVNSLSITEFEGNNYLPLLSELKIQYNNIETSKISTLDEKDQVNKDEFTTFVTLVESANLACQSFSNSKDGQRFLDDTTEITSKLKKLEDLAEITEDFETELNRYINNCAKEREYYMNIDAINNILDDKINLNIIDGVLNGSIQCESPSLQTITSSTKYINESYDKVRTYTDSLTSIYNTSSLKLTESDEIITKLSKENIDLGEETKKIMQDLQFLKSKKTTEQQEIAILQRDLNEDYQALTTLQTYNFYGAQMQTVKDDKMISLSLDDKNTWYAFEDQDEFFQFLKLLNNSDAEVRLIQDKSLNIIDKKDSIVKINASEISKSVMIDLLAQNIRSNNDQISKLNDEQNEIKPKINKYNEYVSQLKETDTVLRKNITSMTSALDQCKEYATEKINTLKSNTDKLNEEIKVEMKRIYSEEISEKDYLVIENPNTAINLDVAELLRIIDDYSKFESKYTNCKQTDNLDIITEKKQIDSIITNGISNFSISTDPVTSLDKYIETANVVYSKGQPINNIDINHYSRSLNQSFIENRNQFSSIEMNAFTITLYPNNLWSQEVRTIEESHKIFECNDTNWNEISILKKLVLEYGECNGLTTEPILINYTPDKKEIDPLIISEINKFIQTNQIKVKGECETF
ncbi:MAG TPA: hypothetical protein PKU78_01440 [Candidatus Dojkabacteria bacterium]|nr:hypothetical protein [Candidatus Dojkabacteria bacterium]HRP51772.1 hypothetical protein [Candidatus Dojkabacteria bacterium]